MNKQHVIPPNSSELTHDILLEDLKVESAEEVKEEQSVEKPKRGRRSSKKK